jgi:aspartate racemase
LIGGLGVGATVYYYQELVKAHLGLGVTANLVVVHANVTRVLQYAAAGDAAGMAEYLLSLIHRLSAAGAQVIAISSATPHLCVPELIQRSPVPVVSMVDEIVREVRDREIRRVALFGTRFTIETGLFGRLKEFDLITPRADEIDFIHQTYLEIVKAGSGTQEQYQGLRRLAHTLVERERVEAIILAGTELSLVFNQTNMDFPHVDGARHHLHAIMEQLIGEESH